MRGPALARAAPRILLVGVALGLGAAIGCYHEDFLVGALCYRDTDCADDQCCAGVRCRPAVAELCNRRPGEVDVFLTAYQACDDVGQCVASGQPICARWAGADVGFCTDLCSGDPTRNCELHPDGFPVFLTPRTCVEVDEQSVCAIDCSVDPTCPPAMQCRQGVCVPTTAP